MVNEMSAKDVHKLIVDTSNGKGIISKLAEYKKKLLAEEKAAAAAEKKKSKEKKLEKGKNKPQKTNDKLQKK